MIKILISSDSNLFIGILSQSSFYPFCLVKFGEVELAGEIAYGREGVGHVATHSDAGGSFIC